MMPNSDASSSPTFNSRGDVTTADVVPGLQITLAQSPAGRNDMDTWNMTTIFDKNFDMEGAFGSSFIPYGEPSGNDEERNGRSYRSA